MALATWGSNLASLVPRPHAQPSIPTGALIPMQPLGSWTGPPGRALFAASPAFDSLLYVTIIYTSTPLLQSTSHPQMERVRS